MLAQVMVTSSIVLILPIPLMSHDIFLRLASIFFDLLCICNQSLAGLRCIVEKVDWSGFIDGRKFKIIALEHGIEVTLGELGGKT